MSLRILDTKLGEDVDVLKVIMLYYNDLSLLPELLDVFGGEAFIKFLDVFGGTTIEVPSSDVIERASRDVSIYLRLEKCTPDNKQSVLSNMANELMMSEARLTRTHFEVKQLLEQKLGLRILKGMLHGTR